MEKKSLIKDIIITLVLLSLAFGISLLFQYVFEVEEHITTIFVFAVFLISVFTKGFVYGILSAIINVDPTVLYFGLLSGATLGGNCTPIGASANITGIGILRKEGYTVKNSDFFKIGIPFTLAAIIPAYIYLWIMYGI